jgi:hypothetical protein
MGQFRVIATGVRGFHDYARLRDLLDRLLSNRLPNVVIHSHCGRGADALATGYAVERGLRLAPILGGRRAALREVDGILAELDHGRAPPRLTGSVLFVPPDRFGR